MTEGERYEDHSEPPPLPGRCRGGRILKSIDLCSSAPEAVARQLADRGLADNYELLAHSLAEVGYDRWRDFDTDDAIRFYTLRMREVDMSKANPADVIADGTNWQFLDEIKREMKT